MFKNNIMISSIEEAFAAIEKRQQKMPVEAIQYLYEHEPNEQITEKIIYVLSNAYNEEVTYDSDNDYYSPMALWYAIVAENHLSESLIEPVISLFTIADDKADWDFLNEQGQYLIGQLCEKFGNIATTKILEVVKDCVEKKRECPVLFMFDCLYYIDKEKHLPLIFDILEHEEFMWLQSFANTLGAAQIQETLERIVALRNILKAKNFSLWSIAEYDEAIEFMKTEKPFLPDSAKPYFKRRQHWQLEYPSTWDKLNKAPTLNEPITVNKKVGRNEPCPCGSGKKYKKCCL